jgi:predicted kinase
VDYPKGHHEKYQSEAEAALKRQLVHMLQHDDANVVLDFSFAFRQDRDHWKALISESGGRWVLVYLDAHPTEIRRRVAARNALIEKDGDSAFFLTEDVLERYLSGFERPVGEGEIVIDVD